MDKTEVMTMTIGQNVIARVDGKMLWIGIDTGESTGFITEKHNETVATVGGGVYIAGGKLALSFYRPVTPAEAKERGLILKARKTA